MRVEHWAVFTSQEGLAMKRGHLQDSGRRARLGVPAAARASRPAIVVFLVAAALTVTSCGPTAEQARAREVVSSSPAAPVPTLLPTVAPEPVTAPTATATPTPEPLKVGVTGNQAGMPQPVQDACQFLLRRDPARMPAGEAGDCVGAAMTAGTGAIQTLTTSSSWIPQGTHTVDFTTAPEFSLTLENPELGLRVTSGAGGGSVDTGSGSVSANASGTPEEAYAAVLAQAAELTVNPDRVAEMLGGTESLEVDYDAVLNGAVRTKISGYRSVDAAADDMMPAGVTLWLDDWYRPVRFELTGQTRGIASSITAVNSAWAS
ncbi:hypothetical protein MUG94_08910 [Arthrobacter gengyunqii]|uniref:Uncharacterized protein n=1 Tax=Arthrobacter gengyunqii TaxID=2886940 RepID=A0A9X1M291_9MICC|nr:hypothetical protein [Arthrobacter gengyunqii]MCC3269332.1 hypothetical protein [Arthrobacter gengyunqii]UOY94721.1 hypothetical protein MUG94_08910 [Arthrobacter gengyunqii]